MNNHNDKNNFSMMRMMVLCMLPFVILLFAGGKLFSAGYLWPIFIGGFVILHFWMMFRGHGPHSKDRSEEDGAEIRKTEPGTPEKKDHSCCH